MAIGPFIRAYEYSKEFAEKNWPGEAVSEEVFEQFGRHMYTSIGMSPQDAEELIQVAIALCDAGEAVDEFESTVTAALLIGWNAGAMSVRDGDETLAG